MIIGRVERQLAVPPPLLFASVLHAAVVFGYIRAPRHYDAAVSASSTVSVVRYALLATALVACSKSPSENKPPSGSAAPSVPAGSAGLGSSAAGSGSADAAPTEAAVVSGPTKSATGALEVSGKITGTFEWKKKDQKSPISCAWSAEKEIGGLRLDLSDGAGHLVTVSIDVPPAELGPARLDVISTDLPEPQKTFSGFKVRGDDEGHIKVTFDNTTLPEKAAAPLLTLKGTIEVTCPKKK